MAGADRAINMALRVQGIGDVERNFKRMGDSGEKEFSRVRKSANGAAQEVSEYHARLKRVAAAARADVANMPDMWKGDALDAARSRNAFVVDRINAEKSRIRSGLPDATLPGAAAGTAAAEGFAGALEAVGGAAGLATLGLSALTVGVGISIDAFNEHDRALDAFNAQLSYAGNLSGATRDQLIDMADAIADATLQSEESVQSALATLARVPGITAQGLEEAATASAQFADAMRGDVADVAETTGEVLTALAENDIKGLVEAMEGLNPVIAANILSLAEAGKTAEAQAVYLKALADAAGDGPNGVARGADRMTKSWENAKRSFGEAFSGPATSALDAIAGAIDFVSARANGLISILASIGGGGGLGGLQGAMDIVNGNGERGGGGGNRIGSIAGRALGMFSSVQARLYQDRADAILNPDKPDRPRRTRSGGGGKSDAEREAERLAREAEAARKAADRVREANEEVVASYRLRADEARARLGLEGAALEAVERRQEIDATVRRLNTDLIEKEVAARKAEAAVAKKPFDEAAARAEVTASLGAQSAALRGFAEDAYDAGKAQDDFTRQLERAQAVYESTRTPIELIKREVASLTDLLRGELITPDTFERRMQQLAEDMVDAADRGRNAWSGLGREVSGTLRNIVMGGGSAIDVVRELTSIVAERLFDKNIGNPISDWIDGMTGNDRDKNIAAARSTLPNAADVTSGSVANLGLNADLAATALGRLAGPDFGGAIDGLASDAGTTGAALRAAGDDATKFGGSLAQVIASLAGGGGGGGLSGFLGLALNLGASALGGGTSVGITNGGAAVKALGKTSGFPGRAGGGDAPVGEPFWLGENGRELGIFTPAGGLRIVGNDQTRRMANDNHGPGPMSVTINVPAGADPRRTTTTVSRAVQGGIQRASTKGLAAGPRSVRK